MDCLFCKIANKEIPVNIIYSDQQVIAFEDIEPRAPHHYLIIPRQHITSLNELDAQTAPLVGQLFLTAKHIAEQKGFALDGYRTVINCNSDGGQSVFHVHVHLLAGRQLTWPPG